MKINIIVSFSIEWISNSRNLLRREELNTQSTDVFRQYLKWDNKQSSMCWWVEQKENEEGSDRIDIYLIAKERIRDISIQSLVMLFLPFSFSLFSINHRQLYVAHPSVSKEEKTPERQCSSFWQRKSCCFSSRRDTFDSLVYRQTDRRIVPMTMKCVFFLVQGERGGHLAFRFITQWSKCEWTRDQAMTSSS